MRTRRLIRFLTITLGALVGLVMAAIIVIYAVSELQLRKTYQFDVTSPPIPSDAASIERGHHLATAVSMCVACHSASLDSPNLAGNVFLDIPPVQLTAPNLTKGAGGIAGHYSDADWVRTLRHGVRPDGSPLLFMPTQSLYNLSDTDLAAIIAYVKSMPPVDNEPPRTQLYLLGRTLLAAGQLQLPAEVVDHNAPRVEAPQPGRTVAYGRYLTAISTCRDCHGANLSGGPIDEPGAPPAPNLTPAGELKGWSEADFIRTLRTGIRPTGVQLREPMPWQIAAQMADDELSAIYRYLQSLPALPYNTPAK